jgi:hypothetical protein
MSFDAEHHVYYRITNAPLLRYPFAHFYVESVFPEPFFRELRSRLPDLAAYKRIDETGTVAKGMYQERFVCPVADAEEAEFAAGAGTFWAEFNGWLMSDAFAGLITEKFRGGMVERFGEGVEARIETDSRLVRDFTNYAISPHTDSPRKLVSLLFYLPADDSMSHLGTSIYAPKQPGFRCEGRAHHPFELFHKVATMPYRPNSLFAFFKTEQAFHGVDQIADEGVARDLLLYNLYVTKLVGAQPTAAAKTGRGGFWQKQQA